MSTPKIRRASPLLIAVAALVTGGCVTTGTTPPSYSRAYYGAGPWDRYYYRPRYGVGARPPVFPDRPVAVPLPEPPPALPEPPPEAVPLPEPPVDIPDMGMPDMDPGGLDLGGPGIGDVEF